MIKPLFTLLTRNYLTLIFSIFALTSCNNDLSIIDEAASLDISSAVTQTEIDEISESIDNIIESVFFNQENTIASKSTYNKSSDENNFLTDCVTITKVITNNSKTVIIDFGDGCTTRKDNFLSGKIIMKINVNIEDQSVTIDNTFENFYFNYKKVEGEVHKTRIKINENGNPQADISKNIKITWEDGSFVTVDGERKREWIEGFGNQIWGDNVFLITGTMTITNKDGVKRIATIIEALKRKTACRFIVSGIVEIVKGEESIQLNYGDGECDDLAIVTKNGVDREIHLRKKRRK